MQIPKVIPARNTMTFGEEIIHQEENYQSALERLRDLYDNAPCGYHSVNGNGLIIEMNKTELNWLGYTREEVIGKMNINELYAPSSKDSFKKDYPQLIRDKGVKDRELEFVRKDGSTFFVLLNATARLDKDGNFLITRSTITDITERKLAEQKLHRSEEKMRSQEELFRILIEASSDIITLLDADYRISYTNPSLQRVLGYEPDEIAGKAIYELIHPDDLPGVIKALSHDSSNPAEVSSEKYRCKHKNGKWIYMEAMGKSLLSKDSKRRAYIINSRDISATVQTEQQLQYKVNELNTFMYKATHDMRAPLSSLLGLIALAKLEPDHDAMFHYFDMIDESTRKMDKILIDLVDITKITQGIPEISEVNLSLLMSEIISSLGNTPGYNEIVFSSQIQLVRPFYSDPKLLRSILQNLLDNSAKYRSAGRKNYIDMEAEETATGIKIFISDNGIGIADTFQQKVFEMFYRATVHSSGTGLGLYIVKNAIEKLGGTIELESKLNVGTRVTINLPCTCPVSERGTC